IAAEPMVRIHCPPAEACWRSHRRLSDRQLARGSASGWEVGNFPSNCPLCQWARLWFTRGSAHTRFSTLVTPESRRMSETLLRDITEYCRRARMAESTFGRLAVNDGKLVSRLRLGGRVRTDTVERVRAFIAGEPEPEVNGVRVHAPAPMSGAADASNFRFYDNRQKYLLFVTTCSEKWVIAQRVAMELGNIHPRPPALRVF